MLFALAVIFNCYSVIPDFVGISANMLTKFPDLITTRRCIWSQYVSKLFSISNLFVLFSWHLWQLPYSTELGFTICCLFMVNLLYRHAWEVLAWVALSYLGCVSTGLSHSIILQCAPLASFDVTSWCPTLPDKLYQLQFLLFLLLQIG